MDKEQYAQIQMERLYHLDEAIEVGEEQIKEGQGWFYYLYVDHEAKTKYSLLIGPRFIAAMHWLRNQQLKYLDEYSKEVYARDEKRGKE